MDNGRQNELYILGSDISDTGNPNPRRGRRGWLITLVALAVPAVCTLLYMVLRPGPEPAVPDYFFEPEGITEPVTAVVETAAGVAEGHIEAVCDSIDGVGLLIFVPRGLTMSLEVGMPDSLDTSIAFAAMAADIRADNMEIVGDFVLAGKRLSRGIAKKGFCAVIDNTISIGMGEQTPLLAEAVERDGYFFRQYALVRNGEPVGNNPRNVSIRRALAVQDDRVVMIQSAGRLTFEEFSRLLVRSGVSDAIYLVGGNAYGWWRDPQGVRHEIGEKLAQVPDNISYIVWRSNTDGTPQ